LPGLPLRRDYGNAQARPAGAKRWRGAFKMGLIQDLLEQVPLAAVLRERVALADQKYEAAMRDVEELKRKVAALERENAELRAQIPETKDGALNADTIRVLVHMFKSEMDDRDVGAIGKTLGMEKSVVKYHLDRLYEAGLAESAGGNYRLGHIYWALTPEGRRHVVERKLV
jgi:DNA-binding MarR family transcriptional regulator